MIEYRNHANTNAMRDHALTATRGMYEALGASEFWGGDAPIGCHNMGVARMSEDPKDGVTNRWGQAHDVPNLFVSDGSVFSTSGAWKSDVNDCRPRDPASGSHRRADEAEDVVGWDSHPQPHSARK